MSKVMIVEDDDSLREIYGIRLAAEGYTVVSARDGEEALAVAVKERPDLIVSDVMMPKISGFDMLDILRSTPETANIKVIMMTALSSDDQRDRGENLGANRYLVKSQVGIEDVVNVVHEVLNDRAANDAVATTAVPAPFTAEAQTTSSTQVFNTQPTANVSTAPAANTTPSAPLPDFSQPMVAPNPSLPPTQDQNTVVPNQNTAAPTMAPSQDPATPTPVPDSIIPPVA